MYREGKRHGFTIGLLVLVSSSALCIFWISNLRSAAIAAKSTLSLYDNTNVLEYQILNAETSVRKYLLTQDPLYSNNYKNAKSRVIQSSLEIEKDLSTLGSA
jgi:CHASE3 domain sensor protein